MAYLDPDRSRVNGRIVLMTIPALVFFILRVMASTGSPDALLTVDEFGPVVNAAVWISPIFVAIQIFKMWEGTAARSGPNILCTILTAVAAAMVWQSSGIHLIL